MFETSRIKLIPLNREQLTLYVTNDLSLENTLGLSPRQRIIPENVQTALNERLIPLVDRNPDHLFFCTLWLIVDKELNTTVGGIAFKGPPGEKREVELGAGTDEEFRNRGYMTEATKLLSAWASGEGVKVVAVSSSDNYASHRTLEKSGFVIVRKEEAWHWEWKGD